MASTSVSEQASSTEKHAHTSLEDVVVQAATDRDGGDGSKNLKGLRHFSRLVADKVQLKGTTTYNVVADELVEELATQARDIEGKPDQKNIRRRVYDALNVLMAMDIIAKDKKEIKWVGFPTDSGGRRELESLKKRNEDIRAMIAEQKRRREEKVLREQRLNQMAEFNVARESQASRNALSYDEPTREKTIHMPFIVMQCSRDTDVEVHIDEDRNEYLFAFSNPFSVHKDVDLIGMLPKSENSASPRTVTPNGVGAASQAGGDSQLEWPSNARGFWNHDAGGYGGP
ncbi:Transcription factor dpl-1 [Borealophlyctis nickersoniae]|nr:Transcription factor dpl-1 [Borealophlyctis nickersoniae]